MTLKHRSDNIGGVHSNSFATLAGPLQDNWGTHHTCFEDRSLTGLGVAATQLEVASQRQQPLVDSSDYAWDRPYLGVELADHDGIRALMRTGHGEAAKEVCGLEPGQRKYDMYMKKF